jgi:hypothetical protein
MRSNRRPPVRRNRNGCLVGLVALIWIILGGLLIYEYWLRPRVSQEIGRQISQQLGPTPVETAVSQTTQPTQPSDPTAANALPTLVASLPSGQVRISETEANAYLSANADKLRPIESATLRFVPGEIQVDLNALGTTSTARMGAAIQAGKIVAIDARIDGPLASFVDVRDIITPLEQQLNAELAAQKRRVTDVSIDQGELVFTVE